MSEEEQTHKPGQHPQEILVDQIIDKVVLRNQDFMNKLRQVNQSSKFDDTLKSFDI